MDAIVIAFAHSHESPLDSLNEEHDQILNLLNSNLRDAYSIVPIRYADKKSLSDRISEVKQDVCLLLYSGHADSDMLLLNDEEASADGFKDLLSLCPKLQLVVLNGCNTEQQVYGLLDLGVKAVVATSDVVRDDRAMAFAIELFKSLTAQQPLGRCI